jgi:hypothetical protein
LDIHRKQLTFDYVETETGRLERGRIASADRERLAGWLTRFDTSTPVVFALEGCTGWRYVVEEMRKAGVEPHLAEPADTAALRGPKRRAKTDNDLWINSAGLPGGCAVAGQSGDGSDGVG